MNGAYATGFDEALSEVKHILERIALSADIKRKEDL